MPGRMDDLSTKGVIGDADEEDDALYVGDGSGANVSRFIMGFITCVPGEIAELGWADDEKEF